MGSCKEPLSKPEPLHYNFVDVHVPSYITETAQAAQRCLGWEAHTRKHPMHLPALLPTGHLPQALQGPHWEPARTGEAAGDMEQWMGEIGRCEKPRKTENTKNLKRGTWRMTPSRALLLVLSPWMYHQGVQGCCSKQPRPDVQGAREQKSAPQLMRSVMPSGAMNSPVWPEPSSIRQKVLLAKRKDQGVRNFPLWVLTHL